MSEHRHRKGGEGYGAPEESDWDETVYVKHDEEPSMAVTAGQNVSRVFRQSKTAPPPAQGFLDEPESSDDDDSENEEFEMSVAELLYSTSSFYAIILPVTITMILSALAVVYINNDQTLAQGAQQMSDAYQVWKISEDESAWTNIAMSLANGLVMVTVICLMTFLIVLLYRFECMKCLIGYMMFCSTSLLGFLGGHMWMVAIQIYNLPVDKFSFFVGLWNFAVVGVASIFYSVGIPKFITQGYLILTSVILAWHLDYFDEYSTWALLFMLALYDLCAVLTPCGPLKALVNLMSKDDAPDMPGLLYEAELPPEARRPGRKRSDQAASSTQQRGTGGNQSNDSDDASGVWENRSFDEFPTIILPLAVARVYSLPVVAIPQQSERAFSRTTNTAAPGAPLLEDNYGEGPNIPDDPTPEQLRADVKVKLPQQGGRIEKIKRGRKNMYMERDRFGNPKRVLWVDRQGRVFAEASDFGDEAEKNTIRLGLGDFIFYSVLVAKAAQYSFTTFAACMLVILAGLGGTLVLLSVFHHALPALPISIALGIFFYIFTRLLMEPYIEAVMIKPYYV